MRERATVSMPEASLSNYMNGPNYGSMVGNVIPQIVNFGPLHLDGDPDGEVPFQQNDHVTEIKCTPGNQREPGFVASATKGYVVDSYPIVYLKIVGLPSCPICSACKTTKLRYLAILGNIFICL